jgi:hypothetical protein
MEQRKQGELQDVDFASMRVLFSVVAASFMTLGVIIYMFGDDQAGAMSVANNPPVQMTERGMRNRAVEPDTVPRTVGQTARP